MESLLIKNVLHDSRKCNILVKGNRIAAITPSFEVPEAEKVIEAEGKAILPSFFNTHTHAAMTLLRGYADDMVLDTWLKEYIWPFEAKLTPEDIRKGTRLAISEMKCSGTTFMNDMYFDIEGAIEEVDKSGMRAAIGVTVMDTHSLAEFAHKKQMVREWKDPTGGRIQLMIAPHAIYTVGEQRLRESAEFARENGLRLHIHLSETHKEVDQCYKEHGCSPVKYLDNIGFLGNDVIAAHCVVVDEQDADILAERGVTIAHCPCSNMKIGSGRMPYEILIKAGCNLTIGTDGASSNNNLDMREEMKFAALLAKVTGNPECLPAEMVLKWATENGAKAFGLNAGVIEEGKLADFILVDLANPKMIPCHNLISNWVYAADSSCISNVVCDGKILL